MPHFLLAIDQGTTSSRSIIFDQNGHIQAQHQIEFQQHYPQKGWVEHDPEEIWQSTLESIKQALHAANLNPATLVGIGITNQRETTVIWERATGKPIYPAIVWQDRRTADKCINLKADGLESMIQQKTGLLLDPYFSGTKIAWILDTVPGAREQAEAGELAFGTIDTFLTWRLTGGQVHKTDATNASRTLLFNINTQKWDSELLSLFNIPAQLLPEVVDNAGEIGTTPKDLLGAPVAITGMAGDQQAALIGQACFEQGMIKSTYGTGCFLMMNIGKQPVINPNRLLTTIAYRLEGNSTYAVEGSIFIAGAAIQWIRDGLGLVKSASETQAIAERSRYDQSVYLVPAFTGLGAPYWDPHARGAILGLTRDTTADDIVTASLQAVAYQTADLINAITTEQPGEQKGSNPISWLRVDGGMVANNWFVQFLADILNIVVDRPKITETTALGAAYLAGLGGGLYTGLESITQLWHSDKSFQPKLEPSLRHQLYQGWLEAVRRIRTQS